MNKGFSNEARPPLTLIPAPSQTIAPDVPLGYDDRDGGGGGGVSLEERIIRVEEDVKELKSEVKGLRWWILGTAIGVAGLALVVIQIQAGWFQKSIDSTQKAADAQAQEMRSIADEIRRDNSRSAEEIRLVRQALERSMGQTQPPQVPPPK